MSSGLQRTTGCYFLNNAFGSYPLFPLTTASTTSKRNSRLAKTPEPVWDRPRTSPAELRRHLYDTASNRTEGRVCSGNRGPAGYFSRRAASKKPGVMEGGTVRAVQYIVRQADGVDVPGQYRVPTFYIS